MMFHEYPAEIAEENWNSVPQPGETIWFGDEEHIVLRVSICNNSKLEMKTHPKNDIKHYEDPVDISFDRREFSESFFDTKKEESFLEKDSLTHD